MKKFFLVIVTILPTLLTAQNGIVISNFAVSGGSVTFNISWNKVGMPTLWLDSAWVFVDYNNAGVMKRLPLAAGATLTATSAPGVGKVITIPGNTQGVWVVGNARTEGSFSATVQLPFSGSNVSGACAYASNYPPLGKWNSEVTELIITGTPPYLMQVESGTITKTVQSGSPFLLPNGYTLKSFTDQTGAPGMTHCIPPTAPESLTASATTVCSGTPITLTVSGGSDGSNSQFEWGTESVGVGGTLTSSNTYSTTPTSTTTFWVRRVSTDGCGTTTAVTRTVTVNALPTTTSLTASTATLCNGSVATLTAIGVSAASYSFDNGGTWQTTTTKTVAPTTTTTYTLKVLSATSCVSSDSKTATITVNALPTTTSLTASTATLCNGSATTLTAVGVNAASYSFDNGGTWQTTTTKNITPTTNTTYTLKVLSAASCVSSDSKTATITVNALPTTTSLTASTVAICNGSAATLTAIGVSAASYSFDNGSTWQTATTKTVAPTTTTTYTLKVLSAASCVSSDSKTATITVNALPTTTSLTASTATSCAGTNVTLTAAGVSAASYSFDNGSIWQTATTKTVAPTTTTTYTLKVLSAASCLSNDSKTATITVTPLNTYTLASGSTNTSATQTIAITSIVYNTTGATDVSATGLPTGVTASFGSSKVTISGTPSATGTFNYSATLTGGCGIVAASGKITVATPPVATPPYAKSSSTWSINGQTWSDVINISACNKTTYSASTTSADCRNNGNYGYLYSWVYVVNNASILCPSPWRVPKTGDFCQAINGSDTNCSTKSVNLINRDGWALGGCCSANGALADQGAIGHYFSSDAYDGQWGLVLTVSTSEAVPHNYGYRSYGRVVRCVR